MDGREIELKLALTPDELERIAAAPCLSLGRLADPATKLLSSVYFDTPDFALASLGIAARVRRIGSGFIQTVKSSGSTTSGLFDRNEWEVTVPSAELDIGQLRLTGLAVFADEGVTARLAPIFATEVTRTVLRLGGTEWEIEVALDRGAVVAGERREELCEVELELRSGTAAHLFQLAARIQGEVAARPLSLAKSERGYRLAAAGPPSLAVKAKTPPLAPGTSVEESFRAIARACLNHLMVNEYCLLATGAGEAVHQMRVAMRRLRSALKVFRSVTATPEFARVKEDLRWLLNHLGPARDAEVFLTEIVNPVLAAHPDNKGLIALQAHWSRDRDARLATALAAVKSRRYGAMILNLGRWIETGDWMAATDEHRRRALSEPIEGFAARRVAKAHRRLIKEGGDSLSRLPPGEQHAVRILCKQVRYAGEFFASLAPRKSTKVFLAELGQLQDVLGCLNDIVVAGSKLSGRGAEPGSARAAGLVAGWHQNRRTALLAEADKTWKRWRAMPIPWEEK